jgi:hypothetical protein
MASPRTNFEAPSIAPKKPLSSSSALRRSRGLLVDQAGIEVGDRHLLAGHRVEMEAGGDFGDAARTLGDDHEVHDDEDCEHDDADHEIAAHHEAAERLDDMAGRVRAPRGRGQGSTVWRRG